MRNSYLILVPRIVLPRLGFTLILRNILNGGSEQVSLSALATEKL